MNALGILLVFVIIGLMVVLGAALTAVSARKLVKQLHPGAPSRGAVVRTVSLNIGLLALGTVLLAYGGLAVYRIIFGF